jgi:ligand-binding SRPBCC domain-containing protein
MFVIKDNTHINAPIERCFLLSTNVDLVARVIGMKAVRGTTSGLIGAGEHVEWGGWKFGLPLRHDSLITRYEPPTFFQDCMASGRFRAYRHDHEFTEMDGRTLLKDTVRFSMPFGPVGKLAGKHILIPHFRDLIRRRFAMLKFIAESEEWRKYLPPA